MGELNSLFTYTRRAKLNKIAKDFFATSITKKMSQANVALILEKVEKLEAAVAGLQAVVQEQASKNALSSIESELKLMRQSEGRNDKHVIDGFFSSKEQMVKDQVREFMLGNFNIQALDDNIEGEIYDFIVEKVWDLTVGRFI